MSGAGVVQPLAPVPVPAATVTEPDNDLLERIEYEILLLESALELTDDNDLIEKINKELSLLVGAKELII